MDERGLSDILAQAADEIEALNETTDSDYGRQLQLAVALHVRSLSRLFCPCHGTEPKRLYWLLNPTEGKTRREHLRTLLTFTGYTETSFATKIGFDPRNLDKLFRDRPGKMAEEWREAAMFHLRDLLGKRYQAEDLTLFLLSIFYPK